MCQKPGFILILKIALLLIILIGCSERQETVSGSSVSREEIVRKETQTIPEISDNQIFRLWHTIDQLDLKQFDFFGKFYDDRLKFYYADHPRLKIGEANVSLLMLYFLDDRLVKIRYHLDRNIEDYLSDSLGIGVLGTKYTRKKNVYATGSALAKLKTYNLSRNEPDVYEISWDRYVILSSFKVNDNSNRLLSFDTIQAKYVYIDQLKSYRDRLIEIENMRLARIKGDTTSTSNLF